MDNKMNWEQCIAALRSTHTLDIKAICRMLKVSRAYFTNNIRPALQDTIFLSNGKANAGMNWTYMASIILKKPISSSLWFNSEEFYKLAFNSITATTRQTRIIPYIWLLKKESIDRYLDLYKEIEKIRVNGTIEQLKDILDQMNAFKKAKENYSLLGIEIYKDLPNPVKRSAAPAIKVNLKELCDTPAQLPALLQKCVAPCDIKDYGDTDESVYRQLFKTGSIRIELDFNAGKKVLYLPNHHNYFPQAGEGEEILIQEQYFQKYHKFFKFMVYNNIP